MKIVLGKLKKIVGKDNVSDDNADLYVYSSDASIHQAILSVGRKDLLTILMVMKSALNPNNILNPNKLMDVPDGWVSTANLRYNMR